MKRIASVLICAACLLGSAAWARSRPTAPIILTVDTASRGYAIPDDFSGLGFETASMLPNRYGVSGYFFTPSNTQLVTLFKNIGVKEIRVGGGIVDGSGSGEHCNAARMTATLGGASIPNDAPWRGKWTQLAISKTAGLP